MPPKAYSQPHATWIASMFGGFLQTKTIEASGS
jgi:hypothetical protein